MHKSSTFDSDVTLTVPAERGCATMQPTARAGTPRAFQSVKLAGLAVTAGLMFVSCGGGSDEELKTPVPNPEQAVAVNPSDPPTAQEQARMAQLNTVLTGGEIPPPAIKLRGGEPATPEVLAAYNQELARTRFRLGESPESLQELQNKWITRLRAMPRLPTPPPGKRIVYDPLNVIIRLDPP